MKITKCKIKGHELYLIKAYCNNCDKFICELCFIDHRSHSITDSLQEKYSEIQTTIKNHKTMLRLFESMLENEKKSKEEYINNKQKEVGNELEKLMLAQKKNLRNALDGIKESEMKDIKAKQVFLLSLDSEVHKLIDENQRAQTDIAKGAIYIKTKAAMKKFEELKNSEVRIQEKSLETINNNNLFPPYHMLQIEFNYSLKENKSISSVQKDLYNCSWLFKLIKQPNSLGIDLIYKVKTYRKETEFQTIAEVVAVEKNYQNICWNSTNTLTNDVICGYQELIKDNMYNYYSKDNKIIVNFYIKYMNYYDIIQDSLKIQNQNE